MDNTEQKIIKLVVNDEHALYLAFSPEDEFNDSVKSYIKSKISSHDYHQNINLTVLSNTPLDEEKFRTAVSNWVKNEKISFRKKEKETLITLFGSVLFASIMIIVSLSIEKQTSVVKYSLLPVMGSISLSKAAGILIKDIPTIKIEKWLLTGLEKNSSITFNYDFDKDFDKVSSQEDNEFSLVQN